MEKKTIMEAVRDNVTVSIPRYLIDDMRREMKSTSTNIDELVVTFVYEALHTPNKETRAALEEAKSGVDLKTVDTFDTETFTNSIFAE